MVDVVDKATRSRMMAGIRGKDTQPEYAIRKFLHGRGLRFRLHKRGLPGRPDLVFARFRTVVFVHGCFWHRHARCRFATTPSTRREFWLGKFSENVARDKRQTKLLQKAGWRVLVFWSCDVSKVHKLQMLEREIRRGDQEHNRGRAGSVRPRS